MSYRVDFAGLVLGKLTVTQYDFDIKKWACRCECGKITYYRSSVIGYAKKKRRAFSCRNHKKEVESIEECIERRICPVCHELFSMEGKKQSAKTCGYSCGSKLKYILNPEKNKKISSGLGAISGQNRTDENKIIGWHHTEETKNRMSVSAKNHTRTEEHAKNLRDASIRLRIEEPWRFGQKRFKRGYCLNSSTDLLEYYASGFELAIMEKLNDDTTVEFWTKKHKITIDYEYEGKNRKYLPDFYIKYKNGSIVILEAKGIIYDQGQVDKKIIAATEFCQQNGYTYQIEYQ